MSIRRKIKILLKQLGVLTPGAILRWRTIDMILKMLLEKRDRGFRYENAYIRNKDLVRRIRERSSLSNVIDMLLPTILIPFDDLERPPQVHFTKDGVLILKHEIKIWNEIFGLTDEYDLLKPLVQILSQRLDEIDRYMQGSYESETKTK